MPDAPAAIRVESPGVGRRRRWLIGGLLASVPIGAIATCVVSLFASQMPYEDFLRLLVPAWFVIPPLIALFAWFFDRSSRRQPGALEVAAGRVTITKNGKSESVPVSELEAGWFVPAEGRLELRRKGGVTFSAALSVNEAESVLHAARLDATQRALTLPLRGVIGTPVRTLLAFTIAAIPSGIAASLLTAAISPRNGLLSGILWLVFSTTAAAASAKWLGAPKVVVGADGITIIHALRRRFVPFREVLSVTRDASRFSNGEHYVGVSVRLRSGVGLHLPLIGESEAAISTLIARIESAMTAPPPATGAAALELLARNGRSLADWRRDIEAVLRAPENYRQVRLSREDLQSALQDSKEPAERRVTAALALAVLGGEEASERIRGAADATASAPVRVVLDQLARGDVDEQALVAALDEDAIARKRD